jgi:serine/threonine-protein kinase
MVGNTGNPRVGTLVGGIYRLIGVLRTTPTARTFTARSGRDGRLVVVKILRVDGAESGQARSRFEAQISIASTLFHPGICPVVDSGIARDGSMYAVMPWFQGSTLGEILVKGALATERTVDLCVQLLSALDYAHTSESCIAISSRATYSLKGMQTRSAR